MSRKRRDDFFIKDAGPATKKRKGQKAAKKDEFEDDGHSLDVLDSDDEKKKKKSEAIDVARNQEAEIEETADEKRIRLAREYLEKLEAVSRDEGGDSEDVANRLHNEVLKKRGKLQKKLADLIQEKYGTQSSEQLSSFVRFHRGHQATTTAVALTNDDTVLYSASKDSSILKWDVDTGQKQTVVKHIFDSKGKRVNILAMSASFDNRYLAIGGSDAILRVWDIRAPPQDKPQKTNETNQSSKPTSKKKKQISTYTSTIPLFHKFLGHKQAISGVAFRQGTSELFSGSYDRTLKLWNVQETSYIETFFGHQSEILTVDAAKKERAVTGGRDGSARYWKVIEETQLLFQGSTSGGTSIEVIRLLSDEMFFTGSDTGSLAIWNVNRKKPLFVTPSAHGSDGSVDRWICSVGAFRESCDVVASGSNDGLLRLWRYSTNPVSLAPLVSFPVNGTVNGIEFANSGKFVALALGQEHRCGRWFHIPHFKNGIALIPL